MGDGLPFLFLQIPKLRIMDPIICNFGKARLQFEGAGWSTS